MKILPSSFVTAAAFLGFSLCAAETISTEQSVPLDAASVLRSTPPVVVEMEASNMAAPPPPTHTPPPPTHTPTPPRPNMNDITNRVAAAQNAAMQMSNRQFQLQSTGVAVYAATKLQRQVAEAHARAFMAALKREEQEEASVDSKPGGGERRLTSSKKHHPDKKKHKKHKRRKHRHHRYIAVDTVKDRRASSKAKRVVMLWDTQSETLVGNNVYDVKSTPSLGHVMVFETYSAEYVGAGAVVPDDNAPGATP